MNILKKNHLINQKKISKKIIIYDSIEKKMKYDGKNTPIELTTLINYFPKNKLYSEEVIIKKGLLIGSYKANIYVKGEGESLVKETKYKNGSISGELKINGLNDSILYQTIFKRGTGYWKDFYYKESKIREEGNVKNNYKEGIWKYYNLSGIIDSTKIYNLKDAVDVRFPYCLFNKTEPCY